MNEYVCLCITVKHKIFRTEKKKLKMRENLSPKSVSPIEKHDEVQGSLTNAIVDSRIRNIRQAASFRELVVCSRQTTHNQALKLPKDYRYPETRLGRMGIGRSPSYSTFTLCNTVNEEEIIVDGERVRIKHPTSWMNVRSLETNERKADEVVDSRISYLWSHVPFRCQLRCYRSPVVSSKISLECESSVFETFGVVGIQALLKSYTPLSTRRSVTPDDVELTRSLLNIESDNYKQYWFVLFVLRYPLDLSWDISRDCKGNRIYVDLTTGLSQYCHPYLPSFRRLLSLSSQPVSENFTLAVPHSDSSSGWLWFWSNELTPEWLAYMASRADKPSEGFFFNFKTGEVCVDAAIIEAQKQASRLRNNSAIKIQKFVRGCLARSLVCAQSTAAIRIQAFGECEEPEMRLHPN